VGESNVVVEFSSFSLGLRQFLQIPIRPQQFLAQFRRYRFFTYGSLEGTERKSEHPPRAIDFLHTTDT
jgi:hypothetical protein